METIVIKLTPELLENDLSKSSEIYISKADCDEFENCKKVYPL